MKKRRHTITPKVCHTLACLKKRRHQRMIHKIHKKHRISYKTIFYMKEYGPKSHVASVILRESIKILLVTSLISSMGGVAIKAVEPKLVVFLPLLILLPALATMIGSFGTIASSKFTTMLFTGKMRQTRWWEIKQVRELVYTMFIIAAISSVYIGALSYAVSMLKGVQFTYIFFAKLIALSMVATISLVGVIILISIVGGIKIYHKKEDPNNFLIPITTSVADFGSMAMLAILATLLF